MKSAAGVSVMDINASVNEEARMRVLLGVAVLSMVACTPIRKCSDGCLPGSKCDEPTQICVRTPFPDAGPMVHREDAGMKFDAGVARTSFAVGSGGVATSNQYRLEGIVGPPAPVGTASSDKYRLTTEENAR